MQEKIRALRAEIDELNLRLLRLLSERGAVAAEIGALQAELGASQYDPVREQEMLDVLVAANQGPFDDATVKSLFKQVFQASMQAGQAAKKRDYLTSRATHAKDTVVEVAGVPIGQGQPPVLIAGPCAIESEAQVMATAAHLAARGVKLFRGGAFKPRTDPYAFQGLGEEGLALGRRAADRHGLLFVSEIITEGHLPLFEQYVDVLQIGARNMQNFELLRAAGRSRKPVLLKRGLAATVEEWLLAAEYLMSEGNPNVILCERGIRTFERYTRNTLDVSAVALAKLESHLPVLVDVAHSGGRRDLLVQLTKAGLAVGADGVMVEVHPNPAVALSDQKQQLDFDAFDAYLQDTGFEGRLAVEPAPEPAALRGT